MKKNRKAIMILQVGLENNYENRSLAWALDYPRCFSYGADRAEALIRLPQAFVAHKEWVARHQQPSWLDSVKDFDVRLGKPGRCTALARRLRAQRGWAMR